MHYGTLCGTIGSDRDTMEHFVEQNGYFIAFPNRGPGDSPPDIRSKSPPLTAREIHARLKWYSAYFLIISR